MIVLLLVPTATWLAWQGLGKRRAMAETKRRERSESRLLNRKAFDAPGARDHRQVDGGQSCLVEHLNPEILQYALTYLDFRSLCSLGMTNSAMKRAANDDSAWRALFCKDFPYQANIDLSTGWKRQYADTKAVHEANEAFYDVFRSKLIAGMRELWLHQDYVSCVHPGNSMIHGYEAVIESWSGIFGWGHRYNIQLADVRARVIGDMAWVTCKEYLNVGGTSETPLLATNAFERHNGIWHMVHHHSSPQLVQAA